MQLDPRQYFERRSRAVKKLKQDNDPNPYPHKFQVTTDMQEFVREYDRLATGEERKDVEVRVGGRIYGKVDDPSSAFQLHQRLTGHRTKSALLGRQPPLLRAPCPRHQDADNVPVEQPHRSPPFC